MKRSDYVASVVGAVVVGTALAFGVGSLGMWIEIQADPSGEFAGLAGAFFGGAAGLSVGSGLGTWAALRWGRHVRAGLTGLLVAVLGPPATIGGFWVGTTDVLQGVTMIVPPAFFIGAVVATRAIVTKVPSGRNSVWEEPPGA